jgi:flagellin-like hook-associated protein FlgL
VKAAAGELFRPSLNISLTSTDLNISVERTPGNAPVPAVQAVTESASIDFRQLKAGESINISGLSFSALRDLDGGEVAAAFAGLSSGSTGGSVDYGEYDGTLSGYSSGPATGSSVTFTSVVSGENVSDISVRLLSGIIDFSLSTQEDSSQAIGTIDSNLLVVQGIQSLLGAGQNTAVSIFNNLNSRGMNLSASLSKVADADYASEMSNLVIMQMIKDASIAMQAQSNLSGKTVAALLRQFERGVR